MVDSQTDAFTVFTKLYGESKFSDILQLAEAKQLSPSTDPLSSNVVAAALFQLGIFSECLLWRH